MTKREIYRDALIATLKLVPPVTMFLTLYLDPRPQNFIIVSAAFYIVTNRGSVINADLSSLPISALERTGIFSV